MPDDASRALVSAALAGLLCVAVNACSSGSDEDAVNAALDSGAGDVSTGGSAGAAPVDASIADAVADSAPEPDSGPSSDASDAETSAEAGVVCDDAGTDGGVITSSTVVPDMTLEKFTADCDALGGTVEIHPHCGGANSCKGMSYDTDTLVFTEHTCKGLNTCAGYSCVLCK